MPSINNFLKGFSDGLPGMKDYRHASRLYVDDNFKLATKAKFHFNVVFETDDNVVVNNAKSLGHEKLELNMLVKSCQLPKFDMRLEEKIQYNKKNKLERRACLQLSHFAFPNIRLILKYCIR